MRPLSFAHRWFQRRLSNSRPWRLNPWISSSGSSPQPDNDESTTNKEKGQLKTATGTWEDEGGSVRTDRSAS